MIHLILGKCIHNVLHGQVLSVIWSKPFPESIAALWRRLKDETGKKAVSASRAAEQSCGA